MITKHQGRESARLQRRHLAWLLPLVVAGCSATNAATSDVDGGAARPDGSIALDGAASPDAARPVDGSAPAVDGGAPGVDGGTPVDAAPLPPDPCIEAGTCPLGQWVNVTPASMSPSVLTAPNGYGPGCVVGDPSRPSDLYVASGGDGLWKSSDYGNTWTKINNSIPYSPIGCPIAVAGTSPATLWISAGSGDGHIFKSTDGGSTFTMTGSVLPADLYSIRVDPYDNTHLISGLHEADGLAESTDSGETWHVVGGAGWLPGGISWFPYFIDTGSAATTRKTWFTIAQDGSAPMMTSDEGASWTVPNGLAIPSDAGVSGLQHPHGASNLSQRGSTLLVGGLYGPGQGVYMSTDLGANWSRVDSGQTPEAIVWATPTNAYAMWGWACSGCNLGANYETATPPTGTWVAGTVPAALITGPNSLVVINDGSHFVFVGAMWTEGLWRYVEP